MQKIEITNTKTQSVFDCILKNNPNLNFQILNKVLRKKDIKLNGKKITKNQTIYSGDLLTVYLPDKKQKQIDIVYQDNSVLIVFKPQGLETTIADKTFTNSDTLEDIFTGCYACHRLDKNTEGLVIMAKNTTTRDLIFDCFKERKIHKYYKAVVYGTVKNQGENLTDYHLKQNNKVYIYSKEQKDSTKIFTNYTVDKQNQDLYLLDINIKTGKTHQIRAHLAHHNIFVLGDERYGNKQVNKTYKAKKQLLCAYKLVFENLPKQISQLNGTTVTANPTFLTKYGF